MRTDSFNGAPVGVLGLGIVGGTMANVLKRSSIEVVGYDPWAGYPDPSLLSKCPITFVCVGTPPGEQPEDGLLTDGIWRSVGAAAEHLEDGATVVIKSTVPPGTNDQLQEDFPQFAFASAPEFLVAEDPYRTFTRPDRIVVGARDAHLGQEIGQLLISLIEVGQWAPLVLTTPLEAEFIKLSSNAMLAAKVAMANELALIAETHDVNWETIQRGVGLDPRIGPSHLTVTRERGFGGACLPKDLRGLIAASREGGGYEPELLEAIEALNKRVRRDA